MNSIFDKLASVQGRKDEVANQNLARLIVDQSDNNAVEELISLLFNHKDKKVQSDCIKVLYEIGYKKPQLIAKYGRQLVELLRHKNNRLVWGAMMALDAITLTDPAFVKSSLIEILNAAENGSTITKDHTVGILAKLNSLGAYKADTFSLLTEQIIVCPIKQLPMYAEKCFFSIDETQKQVFTNLLSNRLSECEKESQRKRLVKIIKKVNTI